MYGMFRKAALLEILKSPFLTGAQALTVQSLSASKNELLTKFLKVGIKITEKFPGSDL